MPHITFIHGISNKPAADRLLTLWQQALKSNNGLDLGTEGVSSTMVYWADVLYMDHDTNVSVHESNDVDASETRDSPMVDLSWRDELSGSEREFVDSLTDKLRIDVEADDDAVPPVEDAGPELERVPLPWWMKKRMMRSLLRDVHHYLFNVESSPRPGSLYRVQDEIRDRFVSAVQAGAAKPGPHIVVSHSMGTVVAYDCLKRVAGCPPVDGLMTIGSPLGLDEIQDKLQPEWSRANGYLDEKLSDAPDSWVNVFDRLDPVAGFDPKIANDYRKLGLTTIKDINEQNHGKWRHNISKYLSGAALRGELSRLLGF